MSGTAESSIGRIVALPRIRDARGNLSFVEGGRHVEFPVRRAYWIYDVPGGEARGGHAHRTLAELLIALSGSFDVRLDDGVHTEVVQLNRSYYGLVVPPMTWRRLENFSTNAVCLSLASEPFDESGYVREHAAYVAERLGAGGGE
jgi:hypothetical protein